MSPTSASFPLTWSPHARPQVLLETGCGRSGLLFQRQAEALGFARPLRRGRGVFIPHPRSKGRRPVPVGCGEGGSVAGAAAWGVVRGTPTGFDRWPAYKGTGSEVSESSPAGTLELDGQFC